MKRLKEKNLKDFLSEIIDSKKKYIAEAMEFKQRILEEKERTSDLRKQKSK